MTPDIEKLRLAIRDLEAQHATGFVDDKQYAEDRAYLEQRLVQAVLKDEGLPASSAPSPALSANTAAAEKNAQQPSAGASRFLMPIAASVGLAACGLAFWWWLSAGPGAAVAPVRPVAASNAASVAASSVSGSSSDKPSALASAPTSVATVAKAGGEAAQAFVEGTVSLSPQLAARASPSDTVLVYVRAPSGPAMPLALTKFQVKDLPQRFRFDDTMALWSTSKLSNFSSIEVFARISKNGAGALSPGDLHGQSGLVPLGSQAVRVEIDTLAR